MKVNSNQLKIFCLFFLSLKALKNQKFFGGRVPKEMVAIPARYFDFNIQNIGTFLSR